MRALLLLLGALLPAGCAAGGAARPAPARPPRPAPPLEVRGEPRDAEAATMAEVLPSEASAPRSDEIAPARDEEGTPADEPIGWVAGAPIAAEELLVEWHRIAPREVWLTVDKLVATRLAFAEARRLGLELDPAAVEARVAQDRDAQRREIERLSPGEDVADFIERELGQSAERYFARLRTATIRQVLAERVVRAWTLGEPNVRLRVLVVPDEADMRAARERLAAGEAFAAVARELSVDDTAQAGGLVPFLVRQERSPLSELAFRTAPGELGGPIRASGHHVLVHVEERREPKAGRWPAVAEEVRATLAEHPVADSEFVLWKLAMERRYPIDLGSLEELLGGE